MKNKKGNVAVIAIIIVIVAITASIITWFVAKRNQTPVQQTAITQPVPVKSAAQAQSTEKSSDWKTYKDDKNIFEFKYPAQWIIMDSNAQIIAKKGQSVFDYYLIFETPDYVSLSEKKDMTGALFFLVAMRQKNMETGSDLPIKNCENYPGLQLVEVDCPDKSTNGSIIKIGDVIAFKRSINNVTEVIFTKDGLSYSMNFIWSKQFPGGDDVFYQTLSTFKFTK